MCVMSVSHGVSVGKMEGELRATMHGPALVMGGKETGRQRVQDPGRTELRTDMTWDGVLENWRGATCPRQRGDSPEPGHREETDNNRDRGGGRTGPSRQRTGLSQTFLDRQRDHGGMHSPGWGGSKISSRRH